MMFRPTFGLLAVALLASQGRAQTTQTTQPTPTTQATRRRPPRPIVNSLGMPFVPVPIPGGKPMLMCVWKTRVKDFDAFVDETHYDATQEMHSLSPKGKGRPAARTGNPPASTRPS